MEFKKIEFARQTNFILALLLIHFVFFGYLCNLYRKDIGVGLIFMYQVLFNPNSFLSLIILMGIVFFMAFREEFYEYGIKNSIWLVPFIIIESWVWQLFIIGRFDLQIIIYYFGHVEGYITILTLLGINFSTAFLAGIAKQRYKIYKKI
ncbi:MAG: hypothetical protein GF317_12730 [Candidatus Lokiarchaeota archaeon]|nr:hypothetical protein [Candidatus Lokiarchaeota archaeon]MBD3200506.1 hypothetical protein [Candidatus Lokiarchaeota archaeon]